MELSFSRGFCPGWLHGCDHKMLVPGLSSAKRGIYLGEVTRIERGQVLVQLAAAVARGDGVVFAGDRQRQQEQGGRVYAVLRNGQPTTEPVRQGVVALTFGRRDLDLRQLWIGQEVWKTDDPRLTRRLRKTFTSPDPLRRVALDLEIEAVAGQPLRIAGRADSGARCELCSSQPLEPAVRHPLSAELLWHQLGRLGGSSYVLRRLKPHIAGQPMVPLSVLGQLRHEMIRQLDASVSQPPHRRLAAEGVVRSLRASLIQQPQASPASGTSGQTTCTHHEDAMGGSHTQRPCLRVLCRHLQQLPSAIRCQAHSVIMDLQDIRQYRQAVELARGEGVEIYLATPRIEKPKERGIFRVLLRDARRWHPGAEPQRAARSLPSMESPRRRTSR